MTVWAQSGFSQRATKPPSAEVRQARIASITFNCAWLTWPRLASRQAGPKSRKMSATSRAGRCTSAPGYFGESSSGVKRYSEQRQGEEGGDRGSGGQCHDELIRIVDAGAEGRWVTELSRWGRSTQDLVQTLDDLHSWKVSVLAQTGLSFDLSTASGQLMRPTMAGLAEFERDLIRERVKSGLAAARAAASPLAGRSASGPPTRRPSVCLPCTVRASVIGRSAATWA